MTEPNDSVNLDSKAVAAEESEGLIDPIRLKTALDLPTPNLRVSAGAESTNHEEMARTVEEIAEDTVELIRRVQTIEERQNQVLSRLDQFEQMLRGLAHQGQVTHRDLVGERKALAVRGVFKEVVPVLDALEAMEAGLDEGGSVQKQLRGVNSALRSILEHLGFEPFRPVVGVPFDPMQMEFSGYAEGPPGVVLAAVRPGYRANDVVVRPAGVRIAAPETTLTPNS